MTTESLKSICESRLLVGFLGEKKQDDWWDCQFMSQPSTTFLAPVFPNTILQAQYNGLCHAASKVHDERIGKGRHYHLYRLPDSTEKALLKCLRDKEFCEQISKYTFGRDSAIGRISELAKDHTDPAEGPVIVGDFTDAKMDILLRLSLAHYIDAFQKGYKTFPYMRCM